MDAFEKIKNSDTKKAIASAVLLNEPGLILKPEKSGFNRDLYESLKMRCIENPLGLIRQINSAISIIANPQQKLQFCLEAAALEAIVERDYVSAFDFLPERNDGNETKSERGIPLYIYDGFVDMGYYAEETGRVREKLLVDKLKLKQELGHAKYMAIEHPAKAALIMARMAHNAFRYSLAAVEEIGKKYDFGLIGLNIYAKKAIGVCRQTGLLYQLLAQEAGIESRIKKGMLNELHVWNTARIESDSMLIDATKMYFKRTKAGFVRKLVAIKAPTLEECYKLARKKGFNYKPHDNSDNFYKYRRLE